MVGDAWDLLGEALLLREEHGDQLVLLLDHVVNLYCGLAGGRKVWHRLLTMAMARHYQPSLDLGHASLDLCHGR